MSPLGVISLLRSCVARRAGRGAALVAALLSLSVPPQAQPLDHPAQARHIAKACIAYLSGQDPAATLGAAGFETLRKRKRSERYRITAARGAQSGQATARFAVGFGNKPFCETDFVIVGEAEARASLDAVISEFGRRGFEARVTPGFWTEGETILASDQARLSAYSIYFEDRATLRITLGHKS